jgi:hypothetical protein
MLVRKIGAAVEVARRGNIVFAYGGSSRDIGAALLVSVKK